MNISLLAPSVNSMSRLLDLSKQLHDYEALSFDVEHITTAFNFLISNPSHGDVFLVAVNHDDEQEIIGFVVLCYSFSVDLGGQIAVIDQIYLTPEWRRQGVGSHVLPNIETHALAKECHAVILEVNIGNSGAREFYEQFDYMPRRQHCIMSKRLMR
ncbi:GNAT family N-acetyltransferase [Enterovibrio nigricans]|uniref:Ribosomal protein S18 acetylase RimI n=1 Tax=Enterovibrio nigricans DSM 22720 TaxID=1121868 RepID=A0A1T4UVR7_9GAMM|nr:GNAT family N-acetyltransferase [Enterovibrio nigricans]PKF50934.1 N-acetyltransferase [Enterovibrio nigricans]SKA56728.1 Ribosomal protein S18 acetylase RimI [Enterovibrio nigricans DSM 22720]